MNGSPQRFRPADLRSSALQASQDIPDHAGRPPIEPILDRVAPDEFDRQTGRRPNRWLTAGGTRSDERHPFDPVYRPRPRRSPSQGAGCRELCHAHADPGAGDPLRARGQGPARRGPDGHRQDRRLRAAHPPAPLRDARPTPAQGLPLPGAEPHPRARQPDRRELPDLWPLPRADLTVVFGGVAQGKQVREMADGVDILVATPGRLLDLINQRA